MDRRDLLKSMAAATLLPRWSGPALASAQARPAHGWNPAIAGPASADLFVSPWGDDAAAGSLDHPLRSVSRAAARLSARGGGSLALRGGLYREAVDLSPLKGDRPDAFSIHRYATERPVITAADLVTGWVACDARLADRYGFDPAGVHLARLPRSRIAHGAPLALNLHEAGRWCSLATLRADLSNPSAAADPETFFEAEPILAGDLIAGLRDPRLGRLNARQLAGARVLVHHAPNMVSAVGIAEFDPGRGTIRLADGRLRVQRQGDRPVLRYALENLAGRLAPGTWAVREAADEVLVFFHPRDPSRLDDAVEASLRGHCVDLGGASHVTLFGLDMIRAAGEDAATGLAVRCLPGKAGPTRDIALHQCRVAETLFAGGRGTGALALTGVEGLRIDAVTIEDIRGSFGVALADCSHVRLRGLRIARVTQSPARFFGVRDTVFAFSSLEDSGQDAHANKFNFYEGSDSVLVYGVQTRNCRGYVTFQKTSRIAFAFCEFDCDPKSYGRALVAQMYPSGAGQGGADGSGDPVAGSTIWLWNLTLVPDARKGDPPNALALGPGGNSQRYRLHNSVLDGGGYADIYLHGADPAKERRSHNSYAGLAYWQQDRYGWRPATGEMPSARTGRAGRDMRDAIADLSRRFPDFADWDRDIDGRPVDWSKAPIGCRVSRG